MAWVGSNRRRLWLPVHGRHHGYAADLLRLLTAFLKNPNVVTQEYSWSEAHCLIVHIVKET